MRSSLPFSSVYRALSLYLKKGQFGLKLCQPYINNTGHRVALSNTILLRREKVFIYAADIFVVSTVAGIMRCTLFFFCLVR